MTVTTRPDAHRGPVVLHGTVVFDGVEIMVVSLEVPLPTVEHAVARAAECGVRVLLNLSPAAKVSPATLGALDVLLVNEHEAAWLTEAGADPRRLLDLGPRAAVVTLGAAGAVVVEPDGVTEVASPEGEAVDTTGGALPRRGARCGSPRSA